MSTPFTETSGINSDWPETCEHPGHCVNAGRDARAAIHHRYRIISLHDSAPFGALPVEIDKLAGFCCCFGPDAVPCAGNAPGNRVNEFIHPSIAFCFARIDKRACGADVSHRHTLFAIAAAQRDCAIDRCNSCLGDSETRSTPGCKTTVQNCNVAHAEEVQQPPGTCCSGKTIVVIQDSAPLAVNPRSADLRFEVSERRQGVASV